MGERIDWDKSRRRNVVLRQGAEPSEFPDLTKQIAKAKGFAKVRGPMLRACSGCGEYYDENAPEHHLCRPRPKGKTVLCRKCGQEVKVSSLRSHLREVHPPPWRLMLPSRTEKLECRYCGHMVPRHHLKAHNKKRHSKRPLHLPR